MISRRQVFVAGATTGIAWPMEALAQLAPKLTRIGFLSTATAARSVARIDALKAGLREFGYEEGKNIVMEYRWAELDNNRLPALAADLVRAKVDIIVAVATPATVAAKRATSTIPIVIVAVGDAVSSGLVASLARPEANVTGMTFLLPQISAKRLEMLRELSPNIRQVAAFANGSARVASDPVYREMELAARSLRISLQRVEVTTIQDFDTAFEAMARSGVEAVEVSDDTLMTTNVKVIADLAIKHRLASIGSVELADAGGLLAYGINRLAMFRRVAYFVDRILKGAKAGDLPVELPTRFEVVLNLRTAQALHLKFPYAITLRADRVIE